MNPVLNSILLIGLHQSCDLLADKRCHLRLEPLRQLLNKFHALASPSLSIWLFKVVLDVLLGLLLVLIQIILSNGDIWQNQDCEDVLQVLLDIVLVLGDWRAIAKVADNSKHESFAFAASCNRPWHYHLPNGLEESVLVILKVLGKLRLIQMH